MQPSQQPAAPAAQAPALDVDLTRWAEQVNAAIDTGMTCLLATQDPDGYPDIAYKGSIQVFDKDHLMWWERSLGEQIAQVQKNPRVVVNFRNTETRTQLRFYGTAEIHQTGDLREQIRSKAPQRELDQDPENKGYGVLVRVDRVRVGRNTVQQRKDAK